MTIDHVPLLDLRRNQEELDTELEDAFRRVLRSGHYILGPEVDALERQCEEYIGVKHAIGVSSGTDALLLALMALGIGPRDEVICPAHTFFATAGAVWRTGAKPVFADIKPGSYNLDPSSVATLITARTRAVIPVHLYGQCADMDELMDLAAAKGIAIIEDAAQALGARYRGRSAGAMGAFGCFSFFPSKNVGALGDAGLLVTNDDQLAEKARVLRTHGGKPKYYHHQVGGNFRIDALQAAMLRAKLKRLDAWTKRRQENAALYTRLFEAGGLAKRAGAAEKDHARIVLPVECQERHVYNQYVIRIPGEGMRDRVRAHLTERKIGTEIYYPVPMHLQKCFATLGGKFGDLPESEAAARETLALPIFPELLDSEIRYVVDTVAAFFA